MNPRLVKVRALLFVLAFIVLILVFADGSSKLSASSNANNANTPVRVRFLASDLPSGAVGICLLRDFEGYGRHSAV
jgi:hypothetical protein